MNPNQLERELLEKHARATMELGRLPLAPLRYSGQVLLQEERDAEKDEARIKREIHNLRARLFALSVGEWVRESAPLVSQEWRLDMWYLPKAQGTQINSFVELREQLRALMSRYAMRNTDSGAGACGFDLCYQGMACAARAAIGQILADEIFGPLVRSGELELRLTTSELVLTDFGESLQLDLVAAMKDEKLQSSPSDAPEPSPAPAGTGMDIGEAVRAMRAGRKVARAGWNGKGMWIVLMDGMKLPPFSTQDTARKVNDRTARWIGEDTALETLPYIAMWTADGKWLPGWLCSQSDLLATDWEIVGDQGSCVAPMG